MSQRLSQAGWISMTRKPGGHLEASRSSRRSEMATVLTPHSSAPDRFQTRARFGGDPGRLERFGAWKWHFRGRMMRHPSQDIGASGADDGIHWFFYPQYGAGAARFIGPSRPAACIPSHCVPSAAPVWERGAMKRWRERLEAGGRGRLRWLSKQLQSLQTS
jgi:hypothetical protein